MSCLTAWFGPFWLLNRTEAKLQRALDQLRESQATLVARSTQIRAKIDEKDARLRQIKIKRINTHGGQLQPEDIDEIRTVMQQRDAWVESLRRFNSLIEHIEKSIIDLENTTALQQGMSALANRSAPLNVDRIDAILERVRHQQEEAHDVTQIIVGTEQPPDLGDEAIINRLKSLEIINEPPAHLRAATDGVPAMPP